MISYERAIIRNAEIINYLEQNMRNASLQRRVGVVDLYGVPFSCQGSTNSPATTRISISPDMVYLMRYELKLEIKPFITPIASGNGLSPVSLTGTADTHQTGDATVSSTPSSHSHSVNPVNVTINPTSHTHTVVAGITETSSTFSDFRVVVDDVDLTPYLAAQHGWVTGEGMYPSGDLDNFDIIEACSFLNETDRRKITRPGYKKVEFKANGVYNVEGKLYLKYSNTLR